MVQSAEQSKRERLEEISVAITKKDSKALEAIAREIAMFDEEWADELFNQALAIEKGI